MKTVVSNSRCPKLSGAVSEIWNQSQRGSVLIRTITVKHATGMIVIQWNNFKVVIPKTRTMKQVQQHYMLQKMTKTRQQQYVQNSMTNVLHWSPKRMSLSKSVCWTMPKIEISPLISWRNTKCHRTMCARHRCATMKRFAQCIALHAIRQEIKIAIRCHWPKQWSVR